ncbi:hypothetical protein [Mycoplasma sp. 3686d]|uniref:hypothetical protein n=1 Tax=Mycoplasma sp. 3686d TaxID=2967300 RepID=UPI00211CF90C|nr:hypothetical protein [Mycoplasma sp. 3686d]UUM24548.1 hypothetical protein NPA12_02500 [Mycoplasma sp. 3686d]
MNLNKWQIIRKIIISVLRIPFFYLFWSFVLTTVLFFMLGQFIQLKTTLLELYQATQLKNWYWFLLMSVTSEFAYLLFKGNKSHKKQKEKNATGNYTNSKNYSNLEQT